MKKLLKTHGIWFKAYSLHYRFCFAYSDNSWNFEWLYFTLSYFNPTCRKWPCFSKLFFIWSFDLVWHQCACHKKPCQVQEWKLLFPFSMPHLRMPWILPWGIERYKFTTGAFSWINWIMASDSCTNEKIINHPIKSYYRNYRTLFCNHQEARPARLLRHIQWFQERKWEKKED